MDPFKGTPIVRFKGTLTESSTFRHDELGSVLFGHCEGSSTKKSRSSSKEEFTSPECVVGGGLGHATLLVSLQVCKVWGCGCRLRWHSKANPEDGLEGAAAEDFPATEPGRGPRRPNPRSFALRSSGLP